MKTVSFFLFVIPILPLNLKAFTETQTDWSGGPGNWGPVTGWEDEFYESSYVLWRRAVDKITLSTVSEHLVSANRQGVFNIVAADIDGDGDLDIVASSTATYDLFYCENADGLGTLWQGHLIDGGKTHPVWVHADDINGDGYIDVICTDKWECVQWYENVGGTGHIWSVHDISTYWKPDHIDSGDLDGDGDVDVVCNYLRWFENVDGAGTQWSCHVFSGRGSQAVEVADIDGDSDLDIVDVYYYPGNNVAWYENDGTGSFASRDIDVDFRYAWSVCCGDVNQDGRIDVVATATSGNNGTVWYENPLGEDDLWTRHEVGNASSKSACCGDLNSDGYMDIVGASLGAGRVTWFRNQDGTGTQWEEINLVDDYGMPVCVITGDIDGDGNQDAVGVSSSGMEICWWNIADTTHAGTLVSSVLEVAEDPSWLYSSYSSITPEGTQVGFQFRTSDDPYNMGVWSDTLWAPGSIAGLVPDGKDYIQYKAILTTESIRFRPILHELNLEWEEYSSASQHEPDQNSFDICNPSRNGASVEIHLAQAETVDIRAYDLSGRLVFSSSEYYTQDNHTVELGLSCSGVYVIDLTAGETHITTLYTVLE